MEGLWEQILHSGGGLASATKFKRAISKFLRRQGSVEPIQNLRAIWSPGADSDGINRVEQLVGIYTARSEPFRRVIKPIEVYGASAGVGVREANITEPSCGFCRVGNAMLALIPALVLRTLGAGGDWYKKPAVPDVVGRGGR